MAVKDLFEVLMPNCGVIVCEGEKEPPTFEDRQNEVLYYRQVKDARYDFELEEIDFFNREIIRIEPCEVDWIKVFVKEADK